MSELHQLAGELADALKNCEKYEEYLKAKEKIMDDDKTRKMLKDYKDKLMKARSKQMSGEEISEELREELQEIQNYVDLNQPVKVYMEKEHEMNMLIKELYEIIFSDLDMGLEKRDADS